MACRSSVLISTKRPLSDASIACRVIHRWSPDGFVNGPSTNRVRLAAFDIRLDVVRWHQPYFVTELAQRSTPMVCGSAGHRSDRARRQRLEEGHKFGAFDRLIENDASVPGNTVNLENILGQIRADCLCGHWRALFLAVDDYCTLAHSMPAEQEPSTASAKGRVANIKAFRV